MAAALAVAGLGFVLAKRRERADLLRERTDVLADQARHRPLRW